MNPSQRRFLLGLAGVFLLAVGAALGILVVRWLDLGWPDTPLSIPLLVAVMLAIALGIWLQRAFHATFTHARRLADDIDIVLSANPGHRAQVDGPAEFRYLAQRVNHAADIFQTTLSGQETAITQAQAGLEQERNRLAALMSELAQGVLVCNSEGQILLYNDRARQLLGKSEERRAGSGFVGLGRSVFGLIDRHTITHALESLRYGLESHEPGSPRTASHFVTSADNGQLLRAAIAPVITPAPDGAINGVPHLSGFVLTLEDITRQAESSARRDLLLRSLTEKLRGSLANIRAAIEAIQDFPQITPQHRALFHKIIYDESVGLSSRLDQMMGEYGEDLNAQWQLADMLAEDLRWALKRRLEEKLGVEVTSEEATDSDLWLRVDGYAVMQLFLFVAEKLQRSYGVRQISLRLGRSGRFATLDLLWPGGSANLDRLREWQSQPLISGEEGIALTLNEVAERHGGEAWFKVESEASRAYLRLLLPMSQAKTAVVSPAAAPTSRPEYYDFDLFHQPGQRPELDERPLSALTFTVFDSETTGLNIAQGDTIISLSAVRIVNGRLLRQEIFDQLVDPQRPVSPASAEITGITQAMLHGQPTIDRVLPQFHRFAEETVLVAHNAAFDMRLLQLLEAETGVSFINPVLDTLLLSAVAHPDRDDHSMEAIAARLGVNIVGRHTALGDALVTAEIFVKLLPLLKQKGITTLQQARQAAEQSYLARVQYG